LTLYGVQYFGCTVTKTLKGEIGVLEGVFSGVKPRGSVSETVVALSSQ
jgi:hypothetical protein